MPQKKTDQKKTAKKKTAAKKRTATGKPAARKGAVAQSGNKTVPSGVRVTDFLSSVEDEAMRRDSKTVARILRRVTGAAPRMWGASIVGFGQYHYAYASGREGDWFLAGFAPRKRELVLYLMGDFPERAALLKRLGKHRTGKACVYVRSLADVDLDVLEELAERSVAALLEGGGGHSAQGP